MKKYLTIMGFESTTPVDLESRELTKKTHLLNVLKKLPVHYYPTVLEKFIIYFL